MASSVIRNFMEQQGFPEEPESVCDLHFYGLCFQPWIVGALVVVAILLRGQKAFADATLPWARDRV